MAAALSLILVVLVASWWVNRKGEDTKLLARAERLIDKQDYRRAVSQLRSIAEHYPASKSAPRALFLAGDILLLNLHEEQEALLSFLLIERDFPDSSWCATAQRRVANIYKYRLHDYDRALVAYQKILDKRPSDHEKIQYEIADTYFRMMNFSQTRIEFESLLTEHPDSTLVPEALFRIGSSFYLEAKAGEAIPVLEKLCDRYPDHAFALEGGFVLAQIYEERGELRKSLKMFRQLEGRYPREAILARRIGQIERRIKKKHQAI